MEGTKRLKVFDWASEPKNYICLKISYIGKNYHGFAVQDGVTTVESELFAALTRVKFIEDNKTCNYSRCGRTDKGVNALGNAVALQVRSRPNHPQGEYDYVGVLNKVLPKDIRVISMAHVPEQFNARFSCLYREYKYFFHIDDYDFRLMQNAAQQFVGLYDFRNFCKLNVVNTDNFRRRIISFELELQGSVVEATIRGMSFLWHQIRCMMAVLMLVGRRLEEPEVIGKMLDVDTVQAKPNYHLAPGETLVLFDCAFENVEFVTEPESHRHTTDILKESWVDALNQSALYGAMLKQLDRVLPIEPSASFVRPATYVSLLDRQTAHSYDQRVSSLTGKKAEAKARSMKSRLENQD